MIAALFGAAVTGTVTLLVVACSAAARERALRSLGAPSPHLADTSAPHAHRNGRIARLADASAWATHRSYVIALAGSVAIGAIVGSWLAGPVGGVAGAIFGAAVVRGGRRRGAGRLRARAEQQLQEYMQTLAACVRAGLSVRRALDEAARDIDPPLRPALDAAMRALAIGEPIDRALDRLASVTGEREARLLAALLSVHARSGGDLPALLDDVARIVGERIEGRRSIRAFTAQGRASGAVLAVLPVAFVALLSWTSGEGLGAFYATPLGSVLLLAGLGCDALGFLWIRRIVEQPARLR